jgi:hypothetical protein
VGWSAPDFELEDNTRLGDLLRDGRGLLLDFTANESPKPLCNGREDRLQFIASHARDEKRVAALLVRPDGFVGWATDAEPDATVVEQSVPRWFGSRSLRTLTGTDDRQFRRRDPGLR